jgi:hypothetical protein
MSARGGERHAGESDQDVRGGHIGNLLGDVRVRGAVETQKVGARACVCGRSAK